MAIKWLYNFHTGKLDQTSVEDAWLLNGNTLGAKKTIGSIDNQDFGIITNGLDRVTVLGSNGYVGIGTTNPTYKLDVNGTIRSTGSVTFGGITLNGASGMSLSSDNRGKYAFGTLTTNGAYPLSLHSGRAGDFNDGYINLFTAGIERLRLDPSGNVGIGTISPTARLHLPAGTSVANTAPLKLTSGVNLTTVEDGAFEFDGTNLFFTVGGVRKIVTLT